MPTEGGYCPVSSCFERAASGRIRRCLRRSRCCAASRERPAVRACRSGLAALRQRVAASSDVKSPTAPTHLFTYASWLGPRDERRKRLPRCRGANLHGDGHRLLSQNAAATVVLGWTPQQGVRVISKASKLPGCYWRLDQEDLTFNDAGDTDAVWPGTTQAFNLQRRPTNPGGNDVAPLPV